MEITVPYPAVRAPGMPEGVVLQPRKPVDADFDAVPIDWFGHDLALSLSADLFSYIIPEHERFFIHTVRAYAERIQDPAERTVLDAFIQQEAIHSTLHAQYNRSRAHVGLQPARDQALIKRTFDWVKRRFPLKLRLGMTAFMEHCTATAAHAALGEHSDLPYQHPTMAALWRWHAVEEIEHKAVAYDLFKKAGGGYFLRVLSALLTVAIDARLIRRLIRNLRADLRASPPPRRVLTEAERELRREARRTIALNNRAMLRMGLAYFRPGFHPWQIDDSARLLPVYRDYAAGGGAPAE